jgi:hypothetical protein
MAVDITEQLPDGSYRVTLPGETPIVLPADSFMFPRNKRGEPRVIGWGDEMTYLGSELAEPYRFFFYQPGRLFGTRKKELLAGLTSLGRYHIQQYIYREYFHQQERRAMRERQYANIDRREEEEEAAARAEAAATGDPELEEEEAGMSNVPKGGRRKTRKGKGKGKRKTRRRRTNRRKV